MSWYCTVLYCTWYYTSTIMCFALYPISTLLCCTWNHTSTVPGTIPLFFGTVHGSVSHTTVLYLETYLHCAVLYLVPYLQPTDLYLAMYLHCTVLYLVPWFHRTVPAISCTVYGLDREVTPLDLSPNISVHLSRLPALFELFCPGCWPSPC